VFGIVGEVGGTDDKSPAAGRLIWRSAVDGMPGVLPDVRVAAITTVMTARSRGGRGVIEDGHMISGWPPISPRPAPARREVQGGYPPERDLVRAPK
jgi:hypothetical protein